MKTLDRDWKEYLAQVDLFIKLANVDKEKSILLSKEMKKYIALKFKMQKWVHPISTGFSTQIYRELYRLIGKNDPYKNLKKLSNAEAIKIVKNLNPKNFRERILISILGNIIDYGACFKGTYDIKNLEKDMEKIKQEKLAIDDSILLKNKIKNSKNIFYLVDNSGEVIFDTFMLNYIQNFVDKKNIYIVGKEKPMQNDMTAKELKQLGFEKYGNVISTGSNCFGLHEDEVSKNFKKKFKKADLIIAKGQAYMEFFGEYDFKNVFNVLKVKYPIRWNGFVLNPDDNIVMSSTRYADKGINYWNNN